MSGNDKLSVMMRRLGFVKLSQYGLVLTPDDRIESVRPNVLTDALGSRIVGWKDDDLAALELERWAPPQAAPTKAAPPLGPPPVPPRSSAQHAAVQAPPVSAFPVASKPVAPAIVAREPIVEEDDWEWTIALARAREPDPPRAKARAADPIAEDAWPKTEPLLELEDYEDDKRGLADIASTVRRAQMHRVTLPAKATPTKPAPAVAAPPPAVTPRTTVIPVPALPSVAAGNNYIKPVVRSSGPLPSAPRLAKGTNPIQPKYVLPQDTAPTPTLPSPPLASSALANDNHAKVAPAPRPSQQLPSIMRR